MNRIIKYKAWERINKVFVGCYMNGLSMNFETGQIYLNGSLNVTDRYILSQFVGTFNGVDVWEGDVVRAWTEEKNWISEDVFSTAEAIGVVEYYQNAFCIVSNGSYNNLWVNANRVEVLGNRFEHPHLLTDKTEESK